MENFTPIASLIGGLLIGLSSAMLLAWSGRIAGISGIVGGSLVAPGPDAPWRVAFLSGLVAAGGLMMVVTPGSYANTLPTSVGLTGVAGLLVGIGTRMGSGCTSGHGVCGIGRLSPRSVLATITFVATGAATVFVALHVLGGRGL